MKTAHKRLALSAALLAGCGYVGEPMVPLLNIPGKVENLSATQRGAVILYEFDVPKLTTEGKQARIGKVDLRAGAGGTNPDGWGHIDPPAASGHVHGEIPAAPWIGKDLALGVKVFGVNGREAGWSNIVTVPVVAPLPTPAGVKAENIAQGVRVSWSGPAGQYRVFRRAPGESDFALAASATGTDWIDTATEYGKEYRYTVQMLQPTGGPVAQSEISEPVAITPRDQFPPAVPAGLNAIAATDHIELVWDRNIDGDLAGYRVYRSQAGPLEKVADIAETPSYTDRAVESGKQYRYAVSAYDRSGNESKPSQPVEVAAP